MHRYNAFLDMPIFSQRHCDLKSTTQADNQRSPQGSSMGCCSDSLSDLVDRGPDNIPQIQPPLYSSTSVKPPFTTNYSSNICRMSALSIANSFSTLPIPNPSGSIDMPSPYLTSFASVQSPTSQPLSLVPAHRTIPNLIPAPRTMPSFSCCAMQSAYAMLMLCYKAHSIPIPESTYESSVAGSGIELLMRSYVDQLTQGLKLVLAALENYSIAFEAIDGMRDQIGEALVAAASSFEGDSLDGNGSDDGVEELDWQSHGVGSIRTTSEWSS